MNRQTLSSHSTESTDHPEVVVTSGAPVLPDSLPDGSPWPKISIVTPSYNQGEYLEETIRSVLLQGYPNLEYIIIDGGSTDNSVEIIRKYEPWLASWVSEKDDGQADAINKGFARATGDVYAWLNSDDVYEPGALSFAGRYFAEHSECDLLYGTGWYIDSDSHKVRKCDSVVPFDPTLQLNINLFLQPAAFWRSSLWHAAGELDRGYHWGLDWEWFIRATRITRPHYVPTDVAMWRYVPGIKTLSGGKRRRAELASITRRYGGVLQPTYYMYRLDQLADWMTERFGRGSIGRIPQFPLTATRLLLKKRNARRYLV